MNLAEKFVLQVVKCDDDPDKLLRVLDAFHSEFKSVIPTGHRSHNIHFKDGSIVEKKYLGDEKSIFEIHKSQQ